MTVRLVLSLALLVGCGAKGDRANGPGNVEKPIATAIGPTATYELIDTTDVYFRFWDAHKDEPLETQIEAFVAEVVAAHPKIYAANVIGLPEDKPYDEALRERLAQALPRAAANLDRIRTTHAKLSSDLTKFEKRFLRTFNDFRYEGRIYVMASLDAFDGATRTVAGETALLFGVETMALGRPEGADAAPFFHHELFHLYHRQALIEANFDATTAERNMAMALWGEGLAVYVSKQLNPAASESELLLSSEMVEQSESRMAELAADLASNLNSADRALYADYFLGAGSGRVPRRCGYYIGMRIAELVGERHDLKALARLHGDELMREIEAALGELATAKSDR